MFDVRILREQTVHVCPIDSVFVFNGFAVGKKINHYHYLFPWGLTVDALC